MEKEKELREVINTMLFVNDLGEFSQICGRLSQLHALTFKIGRLPECSGLSVISKELESCSKELYYATKTLNEAAEKAREVLNE